MSGNTRKTCLMPHLVMCAHAPVYLETRSQNRLKKAGALWLHQPLLRIMMREFGDGVGSLLPQESSNRYQGPH